MVPGAILVNRDKKRVVIGNFLPDPFMDSYKQEALALADILELMDLSDKDFVSLRLNKVFLKKIVHSHILYIKDMEHNISGRNYAN